MRHVSGRRGSGSAGINAEDPAATRFPQSNPSSSPPAKLENCRRKTSTLGTTDGAPVAGGRFFLNFAAPYGTGPVRRGPNACMAAAHALVARRRTMRVPGMVHGGT